ncbi:MAG: Do family serine endopeptidase [Rhodospirillaceae bacterium]|jgi:serine protease Do|nr:Do family serine endopeptidase [Rhodospirillaceae bacterium]MBT5039849.1 Do family serine endopeptidase [Rhodospirillaceae bacterium]
MSKSKFRIITSRKRALLGSLAALALIGVASGPLAINNVQAEGQSTVPVVFAQANFADVIEAVSPAVVSIETSRSVNLISGQGPGHQMMPPPNKAFGSGFIIDGAGYVVTNSHVIDGGEAIFVTLMDGTRLAATIVGGDAKSDLALLKVDAGGDLPALRFGDSAAMRVGSQVVALGNPFGLGHSATVGIISAKGRDIGSGPYDDFLQIDAPINMGNSGGPLFNAKGEVIGVNTAIFSPSGGNVGIGFAIPAATAAEIVADLRDDGKVERAWLGVGIQAIGEDMADSLGLGDEDGAIVSQVMADSPAAAAGIEQGDVILSVNDVDVKQLRDLTRTIAGLKAGETAVLSIMRDGRHITIEAIVGVPAENEMAAAPEESDVLEALGVRLSPLDRMTRRAHGIGEDVSGVVVSGLDRHGVAAGKGVRLGDVIVSVGGDAVTESAAVIDGIKLAEENKRHAVLFLMSRGGEERYVALPLPKA